MQGTGLYARCPEPALAWRYGTPIDMWSVGCIFAEMLRMLDESFAGRLQAPPYAPTAVYSPCSGDSDRPNATCWRFCVRGVNDTVCAVVCQAAQSSLPWEVELGHDTAPWDPGGKRGGSPRQRGESTGVEGGEAPSPVPRTWDSVALGDPEPILNLSSIVGCRWRWL